MRWYNEGMEPVEEFFANFTSEDTRTSYRCDLKQFFAYLSKACPEIVDISQVERVHVINYRNFLGETGGRGGESAAPKTIARKLAALSAYFSFLLEKGIRSSNPTLSVKRPRRDVQRPTSALETQQVRDLIEAVDREKPAGILHRALLVMFFTTGMRRREVLHLRFGDYREINGVKVVEFMGKGGKISQKHLHPWCVETLEDYLSWMRSQGRGHRKEDWLFQPTRNPINPGNLNKPLNPKTINEIIDTYAKKIGLNFKLTPHGARATFIGELLDAGVDIYSVSREVNHSSVKTTQEYDKRRRKVRSGPVNRLRY